MKPGIYLAHKPVGATSFSLVQDLAAAAGGALKVCHGGALDPFAEGLLLLLAGSATALMDHLHAVPKRYVAEIVWGEETDNGDPLGQVIARGDASKLTAEALEAALPAFLGWRDQVPPATSNKRVGGERAYALAHRGEAVDLPPSRVYLHEARWLAHALPERSTLELACRGGFYVRALARDLGRALGCRARLASLRRTAIGPWPDPGQGRREHLAGAQLLPWLGARQLTDHELGDLRLGRPVPRGALAPPDWRLPPGFPGPDPLYRGLHLGKLVALLRPAGEALEAAPLLRRGV